MNEITATEGIIDEANRIRGSHGNSDIGKIQIELANARKKLENEEAEKKRIQEQENELKNIIAKITADFDLKVKNNESLKAQIKELELELEKLKKQCNADIARLTSELAIAKEKEKKLNEKVAELEAEIAKLTREHDAQISSLNADKTPDTLKAEIAKLNKEHEAVVARLNKEHEAVVAKLEQDKTPKNDSELNKLRLELEAERKVKAKDAEQIRSLKTELNKLKEKEEREEREQKTEKAEIKNCDKHEQENKSTISNLKTTIAKLEKQLEEVTKQNKTAPKTGSYKNMDYMKNVKFRGGSLSAYNIVLLIAQISMATGKINHYDHFDYMIHKNNMVYRIPKSDELLLRFVTAFYFNHLGYPFTTDLNALIQFLSTEAYTLLPFEYAKVYISAIPLTPAEIQFFKDWDKRVDQLLDSQININKLNTKLNPKNIFNPLMKVNTSIFNKLPITTQQSLQKLRTMNPSDPINTYNKLNIGFNPKIQIAGKNSALYPKIIINGGSSPFAVIHNDHSPIILLQIQISKLKDQYEQLTNTNLDEIKLQLNDYEQKIKNNIIDIEKLMINIKNDINNNSYDEKKNIELNEYILRLHHRVNKLSKIIDTLMNKNSKIINKKSGSLHNALKN